MHTGERPFVCIEPDCGRSFAQVSNIDVHRIEILIINAIYLSSTQVTNLNNHMKSHHKIQQYVCNQCPRRFTQVTSLNQHLLLHSGLTGLVCPQCPEKTFKQQTQLQQHMKTHGLTFPFECNKCEEKFLQLAHYTQHMSLHEEFKYRCNMCSSSFNQESLLKKHIQRHMDGRFHPCPECPKGFTLKHQLSKHLQMEHASSEAARRLNSKRGPDVAAGKHNCYFDNCEAFFETADELNLHLTSLHGINMSSNNKSGSSKRSRASAAAADTVSQSLSDHFKIKDEQPISLSLSLGLPLPLPPFGNPLNGHGALQHSQMSVHMPDSLNVPEAHQHIALQHHNNHLHPGIAHQQQHHHHQLQAHAMNNISKPHGLELKDFKYKCHECNIVFPSDKDFRSHMYYKHLHPIAQNKM